MKKHINISYRLFPFHKGQRVVWRDVNLSHFLDSGTVVSVKDGPLGEEITINWESPKCQGTVLARDMQPWEQSEREIYTVAPTRPKPANDCLGLSWEKIESMQGGKLSR